MFVSVETPEEMTTPCEGNICGIDTVAFAMEVILKLKQLRDRPGKESERSGWPCNVPRAQDNYMGEYNVALALPRDGRLERVRARLAEGSKFDLELCLRNLGL